MLYQIHILDISRNFVAPIRIPLPINNEGDWLSFGKKLSDWAPCRFKVSTKDPFFEEQGNILQPYKYHVRILRAGATVWQGVIVKNNRRSKDYIEVEARTYLYLLSRILPPHDSADGHGAENYRTFKSGTLAAAVTALINESKIEMSPALSALTTGTIDNPTFPADFKDSAGLALTGAWTFSDTFQVKFDYRDVLYMLKVFGMYCNFDFELSDSMQFNFKQYIGTKQPNMRFTFGEFGNLEDFNAPVDGDEMANNLVGVAADNEDTVLHQWMSDVASMQENGKISGVAAFADVKNGNLLNSRLREELSLVKAGDAELDLIPNHRAPSITDYSVGDTVTADIQYHIINITTPRRIVGYEVHVGATGKERVRLMTNRPRDNQ